MFYFHNNQWTPVEGALIQIAVANADDVWGINANNDIFYLESNQTWQQVPEKLTHISNMGHNAV
ncbi:hypothetical protein L2764_27455 [Shewanella surugensis]|uniref:Uncharacterized protein n=1 Tax=Shewanella surugensis TaxID=212020 RepID=A0ABT0LL01_9GAMM|nr:hypothetical protein [Shewanella surugensis]